MKTNFVLPSTFVMLASVLGACGPQGGSQADSPIQQTLDYIRKNGFPRLSDLLPALPSQLARIPGVETTTAGLPSLPDDLGGASFGDINALVGEARSLAAQGFSEARRLEASIQNLAAPIHNLLGRSDLFTRTSESSTLSMDGAALVQDAVMGGTSIFEQLLGASAFAVDTGGKDGLPAFLVLGIDQATASVDISGLWASASDKDQLKTGFHARVRLAAADDLAVSFTLSPGSLEGIVPGWTSTSCDDDLWQVEVVAMPDGERRLDVAAQECPSTRNAVSTMSFVRTEAGPWQFVGGFAQSFESATGLRAFLGARQGFVVQAAADSDLSHLAAAAAVLGEQDFSEPSQEKINAFGVGQLLARYFDETYWNVEREKAFKRRNDFLSLPTGNFAYWMCYAPVTSSALADSADAVKSKCKGDATNIEASLAALTSLNDVVADYASLDVKRTVQNLVDILSIRNSLFIDSDGAVAFKAPPSAAFEALDTVRMGALPVQLGGLGWTSRAKDLLKIQARAELPTSPFAAVTSGLGGFLRQECKALAGDSAARAGKSVDVSALCAG